MILFVIGLLVGLFIGFGLGGFIGWEMKKDANTTTFKNVTINADREDLIDVIESIEAVNELKEKLNK